jgi:hypothetical protein
MIALVASRRRQLACASLTERQIQRGVLRMARSCFRDVVIHHSPNGAHLAGDAGPLLGDGMLRGWPDLIAVWKPGRCAFMEVKRTRKSKVTDQQVAMHRLLSDLGFPVAIVTSDREAFDFLKSCGAPCSGELL